MPTISWAALDPKEYKRLVLLFAAGVITHAIGPEETLPRSWGFDDYSSRHLRGHSRLIPERTRRCSNFVKSFEVLTKITNNIKVSVDGKTMKWPGSFVLSVRMCYGNFIFNNSVIYIVQYLLYSYFSYIQ